MKVYYDKFFDQRIKDAVACKKLLRQAQYAKVMPEWISEAAWRAICAHWCSPEFSRKRSRAQESRDQPDFAQNRGGSRPYGQTKQYLVSCCDEPNSTCPYITAVLYNFLIGSSYHRKRLMVQKQPLTLILIAA